MYKPSISVVIVTYNSNNFLANCLKSIAEELKEFSYKVIIVDNASTESLDDWHEKYEHVEIIRNNTNMGFAVGNNIGIEATEGDIIWLLNPDTVLLENCVLNALECFKNPQVGIVGNRLLNVDNTVQKSVFKRPTLTNETLRIFGIPSVIHLISNKFPKFIDWVFNGKIHAANALATVKQPIEVQAVLGASMMLRREMLNQIGMFDSRYFMFQEEADLCLRANKEWKIIYCPNSQIIHYGGHSTWDNAGILYFERFRSLLLYFSLYYSNLYVAAYRFVLILTGFFRILLLPTRMYKIDLGLGNYTGKEKNIEFSRMMALKTYIKLIILAFSHLPKAV